MPLYQNDARLKAEPSLEPFGCLATVIRQICEARVARALDPVTTLEWYRWCVANGHVLDREGRRAWVENHEATGRAAQYYLGVRQTFRYVWRHDYVGDYAFGSPESATAFVALVRCRGWSIAHFVECDSDGSRRWDPYWPPKEITSIESIRGYAL